MRKSLVYQQTLFPELTAEFPSTRYQGSKAKLVDWIWDQIANINFNTCLDAFGGTGAVAYRLKREGKRVTYNDLLRFNYYFGKALIENNNIRLNDDDINWLLKKHPDIQYPKFIMKNFHDIYFTDDENAWIDQTITNIRNITNTYKFTIAFYALCQACLIKRPYNLFHRKNLYLRFAEIKRSFGNKVTWDRPFDEWFRILAAEANRAIFLNGQENRAVNYDAIHVQGDYDLVYIDTPYMSEKSVTVDYRLFYHFLEGLTMYDEWKTHIDHRSKHLRLKPLSSEWTNKDQIVSAFAKLFQKYQKSILVVSYRSDGIPSESELVGMLRQYKKRFN